MRVGTFLIVCVLLFVSCEEKRIAIGGLPFQITRGEEWGIIGMNGEIKMINAFAHRPSALVNERLSVPDDSGKYGLYSFSGELKSESPVSTETGTRPDPQPVQVPPNILPGLAEETDI